MFCAGLLLESELPAPEARGPLTPPIAAPAPPAFHAPIVAWGMPPPPPPPPAPAPTGSGTFGAPLASAAWVHSSMPSPMGPTATFGAPSAAQSIFKSIWPIIMDVGGNDWTYPDFEYVINGHLYTKRTLYFTGFDFAARDLVRVELQRFGRIESFNCVLSGSGRPIGFVVCNDSDVTPRVSR